MFSQFFSRKAAPSAPLVSKDEVVKIMKEAASTREALGVIAKRTQASEYQNRVKAMGMIEGAHARLMLAAARTAAKGDENKLLISLIAQGYLYTIPAKAFSLPLKQAGGPTLRTATLAAVKELGLWMPTQAQRAE